ncbi:SDR family NAD(P)-dependent oxidoreductase [Streptomyces sp. NPDC001292]|uniref:SDR family NAD(P)-dependent oxidoreductase n=1 Tax=Streptomyces sp. NPDC001292 TaxID=3364558 RepID=UPI00367EC7E4
MSDTTTAGAVYADLRGRSVSVTGAARGLGLSMARAFAAGGCHVQLIDIDGEELDGVRARLAAAHPEQTIEASAASVTDPAAIGDALGGFQERTGSLDVMVNNAGISANAPSLDLDIELWKRSVDINLTGVFVCAQAAGRIMTAQGRGVVLNTSSMYGVVAAPARAAYCASKAAVASLTKVLAVEWASAGVRVNALAPGYVETDLVASLAAAGRLDLTALRSRTPLSRLGSPGDIANLALFLASDVSANITGQVMVSDGGWSADGFGITATAVTGQ